MSQFEVGQKVFQVDRTLVGDGYIPTEITEIKARFLLTSNGKKWKMNGHMWGNSNYTAPYIVADDTASRLNMMIAREKQVRHKLCKVDWNTIPINVVREINEILKILMTNGDK